MDTTTINNQNQLTEQELKDIFQPEHPEFAAVLDKVQSMDAAQTLKALIGTHALERILDAHARNLLLFQNFTMNPPPPLLLLLLSESF